MKSFLILSLLLAAASIQADDLPRGRVLDRVACTGNDHQSYALYLPTTYSPDHKWPILYCLDPGARGRIPVERFSAAAEKTGFIVAGSNNSRNGPIEVAREAIEWLLRDTHERLAIDDSRTYTAGFSGGARVALAWAGNGQIAGVIACGAAFGSEVPKEVRFRIFGVAGVDDFNYDEVYAMNRELDRRGASQRFADFAGGHEWLPAAVASEALEFMVGHLPSFLPPESREQKKAVGLYAHLIQEIGTSDEPTRRSILKRMHRDSERTDDSVERRVARRILTGTFIGSMEDGRRLLETRQYQQAAQVWERAVLARPDNAQAWYNLALSRAGSSDKRGALEALGQAIDNGFRDRERLEHEPLFDRYRKDPKFISVAATIPK